MVQIKTSELTWMALDYAVSVSENILTKYDSWRKGIFHGEECFFLVKNEIGNSTSSYTYQPSSNWAQGGPISEREKIQISPYGNGAYATYPGSNACYYGDTYLQSAMRCYIASKLGDVVEIPDELVSN